MAPIWGIFPNKRLLYRFMPVNRYLCEVALRRYNCTPRCLEWKRRDNLLFSKLYEEYTWIVVIAAFVSSFFLSGCDSYSSFSGIFTCDHIDKDFISGKTTLKVEELVELTQNGTSITGNYTKVVTALRLKDCSGSVTAPITCTLYDDNIAQCTFPQYTEKEFFCQPSSSYSIGIGCGRARVDCVPFSATLKDTGKMILMEMPEFEKSGIFYEAHSWKMSRKK
jgi:hypothetical protein